eukprot:6199511-Pleurochrysis_carterae.AAC.1
MCAHLHVYKGMCVPCESRDDGCGKPEYSAEQHACNTVRRSSSNQGIWQYLIQQHPRYTDSEAYKRHTRSTNGRSGSRWLYAAVRRTGVRQRRAASVTHLGKNETTNQGPKLIPYEGWVVESTLAGL